MHKRITINKWLETLFYLPEGYTKTRYTPLSQGMAPSNIKTVHLNCLLHIDSNPDRLELFLPPTDGQRSQ